MNITRFPPAESKCFWAFVAFKRCSRSPLPRLIIYLTTILPVMCGCTEQKYSNVPASLNV